jgi:hypothetical protein
MAIDDTDRHVLHCLPSRLDKETQRSARQISFVFDPRSGNAGAGRLQN